MMSLIRGAHARRSIGWYLIEEFEYDLGNPNGS